MTDEDREWIKPGATVVVYCSGVNPSPRRTTVERVAAKSFTVAGLTERIKFETMESKRIGDWHSWCYRVVRPDSEEARCAFHAMHVAALKTRAGASVANWQRGGGSSSVVEIDAVISAMQAYRDALTRGG